MFKHLRWLLTREEYWTAIIGGYHRKFRTSREALDAACEEFLKTGFRADIHHVWWWRDTVFEPKWVYNCQYEAQEVFEFATGRRTRPEGC